MRYLENRQMLPWHGVQSGIVTYLSQPAADRKQANQCPDQDRPTADRIRLLGHKSPYTYRGSALRRKHTKAMGEAWWDIQLPVVVARQNLAYPAAKGG